MDEDTKIKLLTALVSVVLILFIGTLLYHNLEGWNLVDSFYFAAMTLTTVGYGDLYPTHPTSKIITAIYSLLGVGIVLFALSTIASEYLEKREERIIRAARSLHLKNYGLPLRKTSNKNMDKNRSVKKS